MPDARTLRCAIYTRKSTEEGLEQPFNSLHAHRPGGMQANNRAENSHLPIHTPDVPGGGPAGVGEAPVAA